MKNETVLCGGLQLKDVVGVVQRPPYLMWETEGLRQFADLTQRAEIFIQSTDHLLDVVLVRRLSGAFVKRRSSP